MHRYINKKNFLQFGTKQQHINDRLNNIRYTNAPTRNNAIPKSTQCRDETLPKWLFHHFGHTRVCNVHGCCLVRHFAVCACNKMQKKKIVDGEKNCLQSDCAQWQIGIKKICFYMACCTVPAKIYLVDKEAAKQTQKHEQLFRSFTRIARRWKSRQVGYRLSKLWPNAQSVRCWYGF